MYIDGGRILSADGKKFVQNQPEGLSALQKLADLALVHKVTPPDYGTVDQAGVRAQFKDRKSLAMLMSTPGFIPDLEKENFPLAVLPPPTGTLNKTGDQRRVRPLRRRQQRRQGQAEGCARVGEVPHRQPGGEGYPRLAARARPAAQQHRLRHQRQLAA